MNPKSITIVDHVTEWYEITQYHKKQAISVVKLVENMWLTIYPRPTEITYEQGSEFIGHEFRNSLIE